MAKIICNVVIDKGERMGLSSKLRWEVGRILDLRAPQSLGFKAKVCPGNLRQSFRHATQPSFISMWNLFPLGSSCQINILRGTNYTWKKKFWDKVLSSPGWPHDVDKDGPELLILLSLLHRFWDSRHIPSQGVCVMPGIGCRTVCILGSTLLIEIKPQPTDFLLRLPTLCGAPNQNLEYPYMNFLNSGMTGVPPPHPAQHHETN